jgi:NAD(P)-dependent dehydrogenase (short-subunit alcohol dehydrogenase family)
MTTIQGSVIVVTGSASGIGFAIAKEALCRGARVVLTGRNSERLAHAETALDAGEHALFVSGDLRDPEDVARLVETVVEAFGRIDVWVNNAAAVFFSPAEEITPNGWRAVLEANLTSTFLCCRAVFPVLQRQGGGRIINISSLTADRPHPGGAHYAAAKAGVDSLTQTLAVEWARYGIVVNGVAPGAVATEASRFAKEVHRERMEAVLPGGRVAAAEEIAEVVLAVAELATDYLNGETIRADGAYRSVLPSPFVDGEQA